MATKSNVEVDQSGKVEVFTDDTVLAFSDGIAHTILIPARVKRAGVQTLRLRGFDRKLTTLYLFVAGLYLLLRNHLDRINLIIIDLEYAGREATIKARLLEQIRRVHPYFRDDRILFRRIGKRSRAHHQAWQVYRGRAKADCVIQEAEFISALK